MRDSERATLGRIERMRMTWYAVRCARLLGGAKASSPVLRSTALGNHSRLLIFAAVAHLRYVAERWSGAFEN